MMKKRIGVAVVTMILAAVAFTTAVGQDKARSDAGAETGDTPPAEASVSAEAPPQAAEIASRGLGLAAMQEAAKAKKYLFIFFYKTEDGRTQAVRETFDAAMAKLADRAASVGISTLDPTEKAMVNKFGVDRAPMPLILALAPNGAITKAFVRSFDEKEVAKAFVSPCEEKCLKLLQDRRLVFVCVQNDSTRHNAEAMQGVQQFKADQQYAKLTEIVTVDPSDEAAVEFLKKLQVDPETEEAITVMLAPPGRLIATFKGATDKNALATALQKGCAPGSSCCPPKKKP